MAIAGYITTMLLLLLLLLLFESIDQRSARFRAALNIKLKIAHVNYISRQARAAPKSLIRCRSFAKPVGGWYGFASRHSRYRWVEANPA